MKYKVCVYHGEALERYGFDPSHPFNIRRLPAFWQVLEKQPWFSQLCVCEPQQAGQDVIERFHTHAFVEKVKRMSQAGHGFLDYGDTPAFPGVYESAATVVGSVLDAAEKIMQHDCQKAFVPIAGLHHARRDRAGGFCVFNDIGIAIHTLRQEHGLQRIAYVDIDAHHGDGVYYGFEDDPQVLIADIHQDGRTLYPGTGRVNEIGTGKAQGTKFNFPMPPGAGDEAFFKVWEKAEAFLRKSQPEFIILQCGADSLADDPLTLLRYSPQVHAHVTSRLCGWADELGHGRLLACGGGGYNMDNIGKAWVAVVKEMMDAPS